MYEIMKYKNNIKIMKDHRTDRKKKYFKMYTNTLKLKEF